jgi:folate-binding protein YgfZ
MNAWIDRSERARLRVAGPDRVRFLHNLTTQDVKGLPAGRGVEAFVTSLQGKTLAHVTLHALDDAILLRADAGGLDEALPHLRKYGVFDEVALESIGDATFEWHLVGEDLAERLSQRGLEIPGGADLSVVPAELAGSRVLVIREAPSGLPGITLIGPRERMDDLALRLLDGTTALPATEFEALRIRAGTPAWGREVTTANLPQEIDRNDRAICFTKGCYLGQETVARLDALGHVNKIVRGLVFDGPEPPSEAKTLLDEQGNPAGVVTSAAPGTGESPAVGLGLIRARFAAPGTVLGLEGGRSARVSLVPIAL